MIEFIAGLIVALVAFIGGFAAEVYLASRQKGFQRVARTLTELTQSKGGVIEPKSEVGRYFEEFVARNDKDGIDTDLSDVL